MGIRSFADSALTVRGGGTRALPFAVLLIFLAPLCLPAAASPLPALLALALLLVLLASHVRILANWLIVFSLGLSLLPGIYIAFTLIERLQGVPAQLSPYASIAQGTSVLSQAVACTALFACAMALGWLLHAGTTAELPQPSLTRGVVWCPAALLAVGALFAFALLNYGMQEGSTILTLGYVLDRGRAVIYSGMWTVIANFALLFFEIGRPALGPLVRRSVDLLWLIEFIVFLSHGDRADLLAGCLLLLCFRIRGFRRQALVLAACSVLAVPALTFFAVFRQLAATGLVSVRAMLQQTGSDLRNIRDVGDLGDLSVTTAAGIYMIESGRRPLSWGESYGKYLVRLAPTFARARAPDDGEQIFHTYQFDTIGGMTPVSEAYFNFGFLGPALIGFAHGWFIAWLYRTWLRRRTQFSSCIFAVAIAYSFRTYFYDTFDLIKAEAVFLLIFAALAVINAAMLPRAADEKLSPALAP